MCFLDDHPDLKLRGKPKGIRVVLQEHKSIWHRFMTMCIECGTKVVRKCASYVKSQSHKDAECHIIFAKAAGQEDGPSTEDMIASNSMTPLTPDDGWCCM
jgi:hypothetical protein